MAGPQTIQRLPRGLLSLLDMKGTGELPHELAGMLMPVIQVRDLYLADLFQSVRFGTVVVNATGFFGATSAIVPFNELWLLYHMSASSSNMAAGESYRLRLVISRAANGTLELGDTEQTASGLTQRIGLGWSLPELRILRPSDQVGIYCTDVVAGAHNFSVDYSYFRLTY